MSLATMYESFFGLKQKAFNQTPDPDFLYLNERTKEAFDEILHGIERRDGFVVIVGDVGTGKTTLSCALLQKIESRQNVRTVLIQNPMLGELDMLRSILQDLGIRADVAGTGRTEEPGAAGSAREVTKKDLIDLLNAFLAERARENVFTVLVIDESQNLSLEMLEQLRLLSNLETTKKKLLQIIFLGQLEFDQKLAVLRQLDQRVSYRFQTQALSREDTQKYIRHRLVIAGGSHTVRFGPGALRAIHRHSKGYPRLINMICDRSLRLACKERSYTVTRRTVHRAAASLARKGDLLAKAKSRWFKIAASVLLLLLVAALVWLLWRTRHPAPVNPAVAQSEAALPEAQSRVPADIPAALTPPPAKPAASKQTEYVLQVYSFRTSGKAEESAHHLRGLKFPSFVVRQAGQDDAGWFVVYLGPFRDPETARRAGSELLEATGSSSVMRERISPLTQED